MWCAVTECARQTFREQVPGVAERYRRRTVRLGEQVRAVVCLAVPVAVTLIMIFVTWSVLMHAYDLIHVRLFLASLSPGRGGRRRRRGRPRRALRPDRRGPDRTYQFWSPRSSPAAPSSG